MIKDVSELLTKICKRWYITKGLIMNSLVKIIFILAILHLFAVKALSQNNESYYYSNDLSIRFLEAAYNGDYKVVLDCIKKGVDINTENWDGVTALMYATNSGNKDLVKLLLDKGAKVDAKPMNGNTALISASQFGFTDIVEMLLTDSANVHISDNHKATALHYASLYNSDTIVYILLNAGANPNALTYDNSSPLAMASLNGSYESAFLLLDAGANPNSQDKSGFTPLMLASQSGSVPLTELILSSGADVNIQNGRGFSALSLAIMNKHEEIVRLLIANGADTKEVNSISLNARSLATLSGDSAILNIIKNNGVKSNFIPSFVGMAGGIEINFAKRDFFTGFFISQRDFKYNFNYNVGFAFRPSAREIRFKIPEMGEYQFMERRSMFFLDLGKGFSFDPGKNSGISVGGRFMYNFGKYRGTNIQVNGGFSAAPQVYLYSRKNNFEARLGWHYSDYGENDLSKTHITIGLAYHFYNFKAQNINRVYKWLE